MNGHGLNGWNAAGMLVGLRRLQERAKGTHVSLCLHHIYEQSRYRKDRQYDATYSISYDCLSRLLAQISALGLSIVQPPRLGQPASGVSITIDDGLRESVGLAGRLSDDLDVPIGVFMVSSWLETGKAWRALPTVTATLIDKLLAKHRNLYVGSHGHEHERIHIHNYDLFARAQRECVSRWGERATSAAALPYGDDSGLVGVDIGGFTHLTGLGRRSTHASLPRVPLRDATNVFGVSFMATSLCEHAFSFRHALLR